MKPAAVTDDHYWMELFHQGDERALGHIFDLHARSLGYFAEKLIADKQEAEDIVADCFHKLWQRRTAMQSMQHLKSSLYVSCRNSCLNYLRGLKRRSAAQQLYFTQIRQAEEDVFHEIVEADYLGLLNAEIEMLPPRMREIFKLIYLEGKNTQEVAGMLNLSVKTVRNQKANAVELLRTAMFKKGLSAAMQLALLFFLDRP